MRKISAFILLFLWLSVVPGGFVRPANAFAVPLVAGAIGVAVASGLLLSSGVTINRPALPSPSDISSAITAGVGSLSLGFMLTKKFITSAGEILFGKPITLDIDFDEFWEYAKNDVTEFVGQYPELQGILDDAYIPAVLPPLPMTFGDAQDDPIGTIYYSLIRQGVNSSWWTYGTTLLPQSYNFEITGNWTAASTQYSDCAPPEIWEQMPFHALCWSTSVPATTHIVMLNRAPSGYVDCYHTVHPTWKGYQAINAPGHINTEPPPYLPSWSPQELSAGLHGASPAVYSEAVSIVEAHPDVIKSPPPYFTSTEIADFTRSIDNII